MSIPYKEISNLVDYVQNNKEKHSKECSQGDSFPRTRQNQICYDLQVVHDWLLASYVTPPKLEGAKINSWKEFTAYLVIDYCEGIKRSTFTLQDLQRAKKIEIENYSKANKHPFDKIRQQLQFLRKDGFIDFVDNNGTYLLTSRNHPISSS